MKKRTPCKDPNCGCSDPAFTEPQQALSFLQERMAYAGVSDGVAMSYAEDLGDILELYPLVVGLNPEKKDQALLEHVHNQVNAAVSREDIAAILQSAMEYWDQKNKQGKME